MLLCEQSGHCVRYKSEGSVNSFVNSLDYQYRDQLAMLLGVMYNYNAWLYFLTFLILHTTT